MQSKAATTTQTESNWWTTRQLQSVQLYDTNNVHTWQVKEMLTMHTPGR